ncbi:DNA-binding protein [Salmonella enterica subsp. enterica serovar Kentucky]|nr:DNA-binding protein [Salmonella enterica subsp. enterica serovar Kentucky]EKB0962095.1 DNA-binding protein [Salmonella enterica subsp. enterica serovar Kentucky]EKH2018564.1 DNA-binding protein [Salmonella enterica subsp. enterica serovar Kentucky]EKJ4958449.1 DNA-binding protein [Salmonella enterica subsp. enterica serovar Kentucky]
MTSLKTSIKTITYLSDIGCLEIQGASLVFKTIVRLGVGAMSRLNKIDHIINTETKAISQCASQMAKWGIGGRKRLLHVARERAANEVQMYLPDMV